MRCLRVIFCIGAGISSVRAGVPMAAPTAKPAPIPAAVSAPTPVPRASLLPVYATPDATFVPPPGWTTKSEPGEQFPTISGPADDPGAPYIAVKAIHDAKDPFALGDATIKVLSRNPGFQLNQRDAFRTADKQFGLKFVVSVSMEKAVAPEGGTATPSAPVPYTGAPPPVTYRQAYYLIQGPPGIVYVLLATVPEGGWKKFERMLDEMAESWRLAPKGAERRG